MCPMVWASAGRGLAQLRPGRIRTARMEAMAQHVQAMLDFQEAGAEVFDYGNNIRQQAYDDGVTDAFDFPGFVPAYIRPAVLRGQGALPLGGALRRPGRYLPHR